jgi:hypothetical protein
MTATVTALGAVAWLFVLLFCVGLAQAAARGDLALRRALAVERERRLREAQPGRRLQRVA